MMNDLIVKRGFEDVVEELLTYAEQQVTLYQAFGDTEKWMYWVRCWSNLRRAADAIAICLDDSECIEMWQEYSESYSLDSSY